MKRFSKVFVAISLSTAVSLAHAADGVYLGFNVGQATYDFTLDDFNFLDDGSLTSGSLDDSDTSYSFTIGKQLSTNFALEGGYIDFGEVTVDAVSNGTGILYAAGPVNFTADAAGFFLDGKGLLPLNETSSLYGKIGLLMWDGDIALSNAAGNLSGSDDGTDVFYGVGASFAVSDSFSLSIDYSVYDLDGDDVDVFSAGAQFKL